MKIYRLIPLLAALIPSVTACQDTKHSIVAINNVGTNGLVELSKADLLNLLENKQQFVLEQYSPTCSHCEDLKPLLIRYANTQKKVIYTCNMYGLTEEEYNENYKAHYSDIFSDYYVPRLQFINEGKLTYEVNSAKFESYYGLKKIMDKHFLSSKITMVQSAEEYNTYVTSNKDYLVFMYDQDDEKSVTLASQYLITNEIAKAKKPVLLINFINYSGNLDALYTKYGVDYYAFASLVKNNAIIKTIDWSSADGSELNDLINNL